MADLGGPDAEGQRPESAMRACMTVAAHNGLAWLRCAKLRSDDMYDATVGAVETVQLNAEFLAVLLHLSNLVRGVLANDGEVPEACDRRRGRGMVHRGQRQVWTSNRHAALSQQGEGLWRRYLMDKVQVDIENGRSIW
jgi:hypothetical protein